MDSQRLRYVGAGLAGVVAVLHLFHPTFGFPRFVIHLQVGTLFDPRPLLFTISGLLVLVGILLVFNGVLARPVYLGGIALVAAFLVGYGAWHTVLDHGAFWPHIHGHGHHDAGAVEILVLHLRADPAALVSKLAELALLVVLVVLYFDRDE